MCRMPPIGEHDEFNPSSEERAKIDIQNVNREGVLGAAAYGGHPTDTASALPSGSQAPADLGAGATDLETRGRAYSHHEQSSLGPYAHSPHSQGSQSPHGGSYGSYPSVRPLAFQGGRPLGLSSQESIEGADARSRQSSRSRPTPATNFAALFPPPQAVSSVTTVQSAVPSYSFQNQATQQTTTQPIQATSSQSSPLSSIRYHPYTQSSDSSASSSRSHPVFSASHSLVSSRPSSRAVSASAADSPYPTSHSSLPFSSSNTAPHNSLAPNLSSSSTASGAQSWSNLPTHSPVSSSQSKPQRSASISALGQFPFTFTSQRRSTSSTSSTPLHSQTSFHSASPAPYHHYTFEGKEEEDNDISRVGAHHPNRGTGGRDTHATSSQPSNDGPYRTAAALTQYPSSGNTSFGTAPDGASYFGHNLAGPSQKVDTGARGVSSPYAPQENHSSLDHQKFGYSVDRGSENSLAQLPSSHMTLNPSLHQTTISRNMYHADVDMGPLESYDDDDVLGNLPRRYDAALDYANAGGTASGSGSKKDEKQVRRRSSKACDQCRKSKCKCERGADGEPCKSCLMLGTPCTFLGPSRKRGPPKGYIDAIESRLHQTEALVGIILSLASPERGVLEGDDPVPDERARSLLEDLRNNDPLAREIVDRVDRGAYGTKGRKNNTLSANTDTKSSVQAGSGSADEKSSGSTGTAKEGGRASASGGTPRMAGPPASIQGRGRMVELGQEMESSGLSIAHPSNEWQDAVAERLKTTARSRHGASTGSVPGLATTRQVPTASDSGERERQRRRVDSPLSVHGHGHSQFEHSPERLTHPQPGHRHSMGSIGGSSDASLILAGATTAARYSPAAASQASLAYNASAVGQPPSSSSSHSSYGMDSAADETENVEGEEGITGGVGQLSINEEAQVRFHGKASGLHLLGQKSRVDGRNKGGIWHFPKARVWPPVASTPTSHIARAREAEAREREARARLPPRNVQEHLLDLYFTHVHPFLPIVHKQTFLEDFKKLHADQEKDKGTGQQKMADVSAGRDAPADTSEAVISREEPASTHSPHKSPTDDANDSGVDSSSESDRLPMILLLAMLAIAARYAPFAHGTGSSPQQVVIEPSRTAGDAATDQHNGNQAGSNCAGELKVLSPAATSPTTGKKDDLTSDLEEDSALPDPESGHMWTAGDGFLERAKVLLDTCYASSRPSTCQALILMGYREIGIGTMSHSWLYIGMAVRMAQDLGMHRSSDSWFRDGVPIFNPIEQQLRKRIWYACVIMDKYVSAYIGRPLSIFESDYDTRLPSAEDSEELELWIPHESLPNAILNDPIEVVSGPVPPFDPVPGRIISCFNESARLSSILGMIMQAIYAVNPASSRHLEALQLERTLDRWYMDLPEYLRFDPSVKSVSMPPPNVLILHMQYWCAVILLHRPFIPHYVAMHRKRLNPGLHPESPVDQNAYSAAQKNFNLCVSAANRITSIVSIYQERFCLKRCSVFLSYYIFTAGIMHMTTMATNPDDPQALLGLGKCMDILKRIEIVWPSAGRAWELLHGAKDDLPDYELPQASIDRPRKRSADEPVDTVLLGDPSHLHAIRSTQPAPTQIYTPGSANGQRYDPTLDIADNSRPLALFNNYNRWASDNSLEFPAGLSTSVLPQQYSTGFIDERSAASSHRSADTIAEGNGRYGQYWSDYSMGQPSSMLGSMYDLAMLPNANHHDQPGHQASHGSQHTQSFHGSPVYMNDHYNVFNPLHPPS